MFTQDWDPDRMMDGSYGSGMYGGGVLMMVLVLLLVAFLGTMIFWGLRALAPGSHRVVSGPPAGIGSPRDLLDQRLARGDITPEDYRATRQLLEP